MPQPTPVGVPPASSPRASMADDLIDRVVPEELDWRQLVKRYPLPSLLVAGVGGYLVGRSRGAALVATFATFAADTVDSAVDEFLAQL